VIAVTFTGPALEWSVDATAPTEAISVNAAITPTTKADNEE
jgi:hypothetical protein